LLAFGHPFFFDGASALGWSAADVLTVVRDPSSLIGSFKIANVAELLGTVDQDRWAAIRAVEGVLPELSPVSSAVANPDLGTSRTDTTEVARQDFMPFLSAFHQLLNQDTVFDRIGDELPPLLDDPRHAGVGRPVRARAAHMYYSPWDISFESIFELWSTLELIQQNRFEDVRLDEVALDSERIQKNLTATITRVLSASSLQPSLRKRTTLRARPWDTISLRVFLQPAGRAGERAVDLLRPVPRRVGEGSLRIRGGRAFDGCFFCGAGDAGEGPGGADSFEELLAKRGGAEPRRRAERAPDNAEDDRRAA
jgi:hypothetical protein